MKHSTKLIVSIVLATIGMGVTACGGDDDEGGSAKASCEKCAADDKNSFTHG